MSLSISAARRRAKHRPNVRSGYLRGMANPPPMTPAPEPRSFVGIVGRSVWATTLDDLASDLAPALHSLGHEE